MFLIYVKQLVTSLLTFWAFLTIRPLILSKKLWIVEGTFSFLAQVQEVFEGIRVERQEVPLRTARHSANW